MDPDNQLPINILAERDPSSNGYILRVQNISQINPKKVAWREIDGTEKDVDFDQFMDIHSNLEEQRFGRNSKDIEKFEPVFRTTEAPLNNVGNELHCIYELNHINGEYVLRVNNPGSIQQKYIVWRQNPVDHRIRENAQLILIYSVCLLSLYIILHAE